MRLPKLRVCFCCQTPSWQPSEERSLPEAGVPRESAAHKRPLRRAQACAVVRHGSLRLLHPALHTGRAAIQSAPFPCRCTCRRSLIAATPARFRSQRTGSGRRTTTSQRDDGGRMQQLLCPHLAVFRVPSINCRRLHHLQVSHHERQIGAAPADHSAEEMLEGISKPFGKRRHPRRSFCSMPRRS